MIIDKTSKQLVADVTRLTLEKFFDPRHESALEALTTGDTFDNYVDLTTYEVGQAIRKGAGETFVTVFLEQSAIEFAKAYLHAMHNMQAPE